MCKLVLDRGGMADFTSVSNVFIDKYMPSANGEFVKVYLHLLRLINSGNQDSSGELCTEKIADKFNMLESDVVRALNYWSDLGILSFSMVENTNVISETSSKISGNTGTAEAHYTTAELCSNNIIDNAGTAYSNKVVRGTTETFLSSAVGETSTEVVPESTGYVIPVKKRYTAKELTEFSQNEDLKHLTFLAQTYLGKTLNSSDINSILYMLDGLAFDTEFIEYIMETCISLGHKSLSYIEKQAVEYARKGISTISEAKSDEKLRRAIFKSIYKVFGLSSKSPVKKEVAYVTKWTDSYGFSDEIIIEACNRTMEHTHSGSFQYTDTILTNWFNSNARSMEAIKQLDAAHSEKMNNVFKPKTTPTRNKKAKAKTFDQRTYDYDDLELKLIANRDKRCKSTEK